MTDSFVKLNRSEETEWLLHNKPKAFLLLTHIAIRARWEVGNPDGLKPGECHIGDWEKMGLTRQEYRSALQVLALRKTIEIIETCRTRKKSTTGSTTVGTLVRLIDSTIYDINKETHNHRINQCPTTDQPPTNHELECKEDISNDISNKEDAQTAAQPRTIDALTFSFQSMRFEGISEDDQKNWKLIYPHIDLLVEITKACQWLQANPSKSRKKNWRKFLTGWFARTNEKLENKKAFGTISGGNSTDRRTKDINGNPVENQYAGRF